MNAAILKTTSPDNQSWCLSIILIWGIIFLICCPIISEAAGTSTWDQWLDSAYELTWHDRDAIQAWIKTNENTTFDKKLSLFVEEWEQRLSKQTQNQEFENYPDKAYRHLAIAQLLLYLSSSDKTYLKNALITIDCEMLKSKIDLPEFAFWYYYIQALNHMEEGDSAGFIKDIYRIWFDVVLKLESSQFEFGPTSSLHNLPGYYQSLPHLYSNLANLILRRAIVLRKMTELDSLGVIILNLSQRMPPTGYGKWVENIAKQISGPETDDFRLTYTVLAMETQNQRQKAEDLIDSANDKTRIEQSMLSAHEYYDCLYTLAKSRHGQATAITQHLNFISFALSRLYQKGPRQSVIASVALLKRKKGKTWRESESVVQRGIKLFDELARVDVLKNGWINQGFLSHATYVNAMHDLWRAIMSLSIDTAIYYKQFVDPKNPETLKQNIPLIEDALNRYLSFFQTYAEKGYLDPENLDVIPDNAFFGASEAAELLSDMQFFAGSWAKGVDNYNLAQIRRLQAAEIFPFDINHYFQLAKHLARLGRLESYKKSVFMLAYSIRNSKIITGNGHLMQGNLSILQQLIPEIILHAPENIVLENGPNSIPKTISWRIENIVQALEPQVENNLIDANSYKLIRQFAQTIKRRSDAPSFSKKEIAIILEELRQINDLLDTFTQFKTGSKNNLYDVMVAHETFPRKFKQMCLDLKQIEQEGVLLEKLPDIKKLRDAMVLEIDHPLHTILRRFYYEYSCENLNYIRLLAGQEPIVPYSLDNLQKPTARADNSTLQRLSRDQMLQ